jgi:hypothetical protein
VAGVGCRAVSADGITDVTLPVSKLAPQVSRDVDGGAFAAQREGDSLAYSPARAGNQAYAIGKDLRPVFHLERPQQPWSLSPNAVLERNVVESASLIGFGVETEFVRPQ